MKNVKNTQKSVNLMPSLWSQINPQLLGRWIKEDESEDGQAFRGNGKLTPDQEKIRKLKAQVKRLEMER